MCCSETVLITPRTPEQKKLFKISQKRYWGSRDWQDIYKLRSSIERYFGHMKEHHGAKRQAHAIRGLGMATLCTSISFASTKIPRLRKWATTQENPPQHPLLFSKEIDYDYGKCEHEYEELAS
jgi:hypothetical protein